LGDSVLAVNSLLAKHENIENALKSQQSVFDSLEQRAQYMLKQKYSQTQLIQSLLNETQLKRKDLIQLCSQRQKKLDDSLLFQNFLLNYYETIQWIKEKMSTAIDRTYLDLTNLQTKIQRHISFMIDLKKGGVKRVEDVHKEADSLMARHQSTAMSLSAVSPQIINEIQE
jgi:hypothetical protein